MNSPRGEIKLTHHLNHRRQKTEKYLFYRNLLYIVCSKGVYGSPHDPIQYCAAVLPVCKYDPAGLGAGTMTVKTTSQGVLHCQIW